LNNLSLKFLKPTEIAHDIPFFKRFWLNSSFISPWREIRASASSSIYLSITFLSSFSSASDAFDLLFLVTLFFAETRRVSIGFISFGHFLCPHCQPLANYNQIRVLERSCSTQTWLHTSVYTIHDDEGAATSRKCTRRKCTRRKSTSLEEHLVGRAPRRQTSSQHRSSNRAACNTAMQVQKVRFTKDEDAIDPTVEVHLSIWASNSKLDFMKTLSQLH
jgi:hypothetical protein